MMSSLVSSIYKSRQTILDLMNTQGYNTDNYTGFSVNEVNTMNVNNQLDIVLEQVDKENKKKVYILYYLSKSIKPAFIQEKIDDLFEVDNVADETKILKKSDTLYIISKEDLNDTLTEHLKYIWERDNIFIVVINITRLQFNILNHTLVPNHRIMDASEVIAVKKKYNVMSDADFPDISRFDPVACAIGIRPGEICEITRPSKTAITSLYYRRCT